MATILSLNKFQEIKYVSPNNVTGLKAKWMNKLIEEVEFGKIQKLLGTDIYNAILNDSQASPIAPDVQEILDEGLYKCIAYFVYSRYIQESMLADTYTGAVIKDRKDSTPAPTGQLKNVANEYVDMAMMAYELVKDKIQAKYGTPVETVKTGFSEIIGVRRGFENGKRIKFCTNYF